MGQEQLERQEQYHDGVMTGAWLSAAALSGLSSYVHFDGANSGRDKLVGALLAGAAVMELGAAALRWFGSREARVE